MVTSIAITPEEHRHRCDALLERLRAEELAGVVLFDPYYVLYYAGFAFAPTERPIAFVLAADGERALVVPRLEVEHAEAKAMFDRVEHYLEYPGDPRSEVAIETALSALGLTGKIGADQDGYPWILGYRGPTLSELSGATVVRVAAQIEEQMAIKSEAEISLIRESCRWGNLAHRLLQRYTRPGSPRPRWRSVRSNEATFAMLDAIGEIYRAQSFFIERRARGLSRPDRPQLRDPTRARGKHRLPGGRRTRDRCERAGMGLPLGARADDGDRRADSEQERMFGHMKAVQEVAFEAIRPGATCSEVDMAVRTYFAQHDLFAYWRHHTGHAIGLRYHEGPFLDSGDPTEIRPGMVFTVEPGLYAPELGGFRHSDTVLVTDDGIEILTYYPRDLASLIIPA